MTKGITGAALRHWIDESKPEHQRPAKKAKP